MATEKYFVFSESGELKRMKGRIVRFLDNEDPSGSDKSAIRTSLEVSPDAAGLVQADVGTAPNEIPVNGMLGDMAYQDADSVAIDTLEVTDKVSGTLNIATASPEAIADADADDLVIGDGVLTNFGATIATNSSGQAKINFADGAGANAARGQIKYDHQFDKLSVSTAGAERVVVDEYGRTGIGTSSPSAGAVGGKVVHVQSSGETASVRVDRSDASTAGTLSLTAGNSTLGVYGTGSKPIAFSVNGSEVARLDDAGRLGVNNTSPGTNANVNADDLVVGNGGEHGITIYSGSANNGRLFFSDGTGTDSYRGIIRYDHGSNAMVFGTNSSDRWTINSTGNLVAGANLGIDFGSGATLSDYEEGTFTPTIYYQNSSGLTISYTTQTGRYVRVGDLVSVQAYLVWTVTGTPANDNIGVSMPLAPVAARQYLQCTDSQGQSAAAEVTSLPQVAIATSSSLVGNLADNIGAGTHTIIVSGTYQTS